MHMCVIAADISSSCLAAGAEGGDGILGSAPPRRVAVLQKHRQVWSNRMC